MTSGDTWTHRKPLHGAALEDFGHSQQTTWRERVSVRLLFGAEKGELKAHRHVE